MTRQFRPRRWRPGLAPTAALATRGLVMAGLVMAGFVTPAVLGAQTPGRLSLTVLDATGSPLASARVRLSCPELPRFEQLRTSDTKGRLLLTFPDATRTFRVEITRDGFRSVELEVKAVPDELLRREIRLAAEPPPGAAGSAAVRAELERSVTVAESHNAGVEALRAGDDPAAIVAFERALELEPRFVASLVGLAVARLRLGEHAAAGAAAARALEVEPGNVRALGVRYTAARALGEDLAASAALAALETADPDAAADLLVEQGVGRFESGDLAASSALVLRALELAPGHPRAHYRLALCRLATGETAEARRLFERFLELAPEDPSAPTAREMLAAIGHGAAR